MSAEVYSTDLSSMIRHWTWCAEDTGFLASRFAAHGDDERAKAFATVSFHFAGLVHYWRDERGHK